TASFTRSSNFSPSTNAIIYQFDLTVVAPDDDVNGVARWQIGNGYNTNTNGVEGNSDTFAQIGIDFRDNNRFRFRNYTNSGNSSNSTEYNQNTTQSVTWVMNKSGSTISYLSPSGS